MLNFIREIFGVYERFLLSLLHIRSGHLEMVRETRVLKRVYYDRFLGFYFSIAIALLETEKVDYLQRSSGPFIPENLRLIRAYTICISTG